MDTKWTMWRNHASAQDSINAWIGRCTKPWSGTQWTHVRYFRLSFSLVFLVFFSLKKKKIQVSDHFKTLSSGLQLEQWQAVQFSPLTDWVVRGIMRDNSAEIFHSFLWEALAWAGVSTLGHCPSSISSADYGLANPSGCPEGWFWRGCHGVWHAQTRQVSVVWLQACCRV